MKSIVYVVLVENRHIDTEVHLFSKSEKAIAFAQKVFDNNIGDRKSVRVQPIDVDAYEDETP